MTIPKAYEFELYPHFQHEQSVVTAIAGQIVAAQVGIEGLGVVFADDTAVARRALVIARTIVDQSREIFNVRIQQERAMAQMAQQAHSTINGAN